MKVRLGALAQQLRTALAGRVSSASLDVLSMLVEEYAGGPAPDEPDRLATLETSFDLDGLDVDLLTVAVSAEIDPRFCAVYADLVGPQHHRPTVALALEVSGHGFLSAEARIRLEPGGSLRRHLLIEVEGGGPALLRALCAPERVVSHLLGGAAQDLALRDLVVEVPARFNVESEKLGRALSAGVRLGHVRSRPRTTGLATAQAAFAHLGVDTLVVDLGRRSVLDEPVSLLRIAAREAALRRCGLVVTGADDVLTRDREALAALEDAPTAVLVVDDLVWNGDWVRAPSVTVEATELGLDERTALWSVAISPEVAQEQDPDGWHDLLRLRMTPEDVVRSAQAAAVEAATGTDLTVTVLREAARAQGSTQLQSSAQRIRPRATLDDLVLPSTTRQALDELVSWARNREALLEGSHLTGKGNRGRGLTAMFAGPPGTGKTLAAEAVAGELGVELCTVDLSAVVDKYIGESEKRLERVITEAENLNVVLFFDEADALFGTRSAVTDARDRYANQGVSYLLQRIERFQGLALLATNFRGNLDAAFSRRLHHVVSFLEPDAPTRRRLWEAHLAELDSFDDSDPLDLDWLEQSVELAGGDIRNAVLTAAFTAAAEGLSTPLGMRHVMMAVQREYQKVGRRMPPLPLGVKMP